MTYKVGKSRIKVGFISQWFLPEPVIVPTNLFDALTPSFDVTALTGQPNYPTGLVHPGYSARSIGERFENGRRVRRTPLYPDHSDSTIGRILNYLSWASSATLFGGPAIYKQDVNFVYASPILAAAPAVVARLFGKVPYVLSIQDLWPDSVFATGFLESRILRKLAEASLGAFASLSYRLASEIVVISPGMADILVQRGVDRSKIHLIYNWADESIFDSEMRFEVKASVEPHRRPASKILTYAGNLGPAQELHHVITALSDIRDEQTEVHLNLVGDGVEEARLKGLVEQLGLTDRVKFTGRVTAAEVPAQLQSGNASLVSLGDSALFAHTMPSKVQSILACGSPLFVVGAGDVAELVTRDGAGWVAKPGDHDSIVAALREFASDTSTSETGLIARELYENRMSRAVGTRKLLSIIEATCRRQSKDGGDCSTS